MKKILFFILTLLIMPLSSLAANYDINHFYIDAYLKENGDMDVSELIVLNGTFNGYERDIYYTSEYSSYSASNIENLSVYAKYVGDISFDTFYESFDNFNEVSSANNGDNSKYVLTNLSNGIKLRMYYATDNSTTAFLIKYTLKDVGIKHEDVVEYYWNFIGNDFEDTINDLQIRINYPTKLSEDDFNWWFHGPLTGSSSIVHVNSNYTSVLGIIKEVKPSEEVDFRSLIVKDNFNYSLFSKKSNDTVRESIIETEDAIVAKDNDLRKKNKIIFYTIESLAIGYYILLVILWIYVYKKYDKERKPKFNLTYNREFIDDYNVEVIDYLIHSNITPNAMSASLMNLIYKKNVTVEKLEDKKNNYKFTLVSNNNLSDTENYLVDFLFKTVGADGTFTTKELKSYASSTVTCNNFMNSYTKWKNKVIEDGKKQEFYDKLPSKYGYGFFMLFLAFAILFISIMLNVQIFIVYTLIFASAIFIIYIGAIKRKSEKGIEHYARWMAFKKFLNDFGTFNAKELPEIILWEKYLVYATIFDLATKVKNDMNVKIKEIDTTNMYISSNYIFVSDFNINTIVASSFNDAVSSARNTINRETINSSSGTFGGHGGGFSSGAGFGGGGGGGRGF